MENKRYGHEKMVIYQNMDKIDCMVQREILSGIPRYQLKIRSQIDSASDSIGANFVEGYYSGSIKEYLRFLRYSKRSMGELKERVRRCLRKNYISLHSYSNFDSLINQTAYLFSRLTQALESKLESKG